MRAGRRDVPVTHPDKVLFPADGITKGDLAAYYRDVAGWMVPHVRKRPVSMQRFNAGISREGFFQKNLPRGAPDWLHRVEVSKRGGSLVHALADDAAALVWLANQNCITPHVWLSRADRLDTPDRMIWDLDPAGDGHGAFGLVRRTALELGALLRELGVQPWAMVTGSRGVHVVVALRRRHGFEAVHRAARAIADELVARRPGDLTTEFYVRKREGRLFVDVNRNARAATAVPPYAVRPRPRAPVATPLRWEELEDPSLRADRFTVRTVLDRGEDPWAGIARTAGRLPAP
jgi:bifunctional non-homologous end joining protein LigD